MSPEALPATVHVIGATGRSGRALCAVLAGRAVPVVRSRERWEALGFAPAPRIADLTDTPSLAAALADASHIVSCAHARHTPAILAASAPDARLVLLGSTRKFTRWPDAHGNGVLAGEAALLGSGRRGVMLHPTMIYGAEGEDNVQRLAALLRRTPVLPLPGGGRFLVQPIYQGDVTRSILAALAQEWMGPATMVIAGPAALPYAAFVRAAARAAGLGKRWIVPFPAAPLIAAAPLLRRVPGLPPVEAAEIRRLTEDKAFDITAMRRVLGVEPISLEQGLALTFRSPHA